MERPWPCGLWALLGALVLAALACLCLGWGDTAAQAVRERSQADAAQILQAAGFGWVHLEISDDVGRLVGEAPSLPQRAAAFSAAGPLLMSMMGMPGVFTRLEDGQTSPQPELPALPSQAASGAGAAASISSKVAPAAEQVVDAAIADCELAIAHLLQAERSRFPSAWPSWRQAACHWCAAWRIRRDAARRRTSAIAASNSIWPRWRRPEHGPPVSVPSSHDAIARR